MTAAFNSLVEQWAAGIWRATWQGSAAILFVWGLCRVLPQMPPRVRCWLWRLAYLKLLIALIWTTPLELPLLPSPRPPEQVSAPLQTPAPRPALHLPQVHINGTNIPAHDVVAKASLTPLGALAILWLLGVMVVGAELVREWCSARLRGAAPPDATAHAALAADFKRLCRRFGVSRPISLLVTDGSARPHVSGVIHPAIVLPAQMLAESARAGLLAVLAHEIAHVKRKDLLWNWLPAVAHALLFFCPLVWLANREWQIAQEIACDEMAVLNTRTDAAEYGEMLVRMVAPNQRWRRAGIGALGIVETPQTLKRRLIAMKYVHPISRRKLVLAGVACSALALFGVVPWQVVAQEARGNRILFVSNREDPKRFSIFAMDPDGSHVTRLTRGPVPEFEVVPSSDKKLKIRPAASHRNVMELDPVWSPDGKRIAFTLAVPEKDGKVKMNLYVMNADGSGCKEVTYFESRLKAMTPAWSPDGKYIAFTLQSPNNGAPGGLDTAVLVTDLEGFWPVAEGMWPTWSHDGKTVLFSYFADRKGVKTNLYERHFTGAEGTQKRLVEDVIQAALSPDGKRLAYISNTVGPNGEKTGSIFVSHADGSNPKTLTGPRDLTPIGLQWSSDGRQIYFTRPASPGVTQPANYQIFAVDADGSNLRALTKGDAPDYLGAAPGPVLANDWMNRITNVK